MRLYAAVNGRAEPVIDTRYPHVLISYALDPRLSILDAYTPESVLIDSGAFTAWTKGRQIDVDEYGKWAAGLAAKTGTLIPDDLRFINLDVIPGERGRAPTTSEVDKAATASMANADRLRDEHGLAIMEVYHYGEGADILDTLLERRRPGEVLGIGGSVGVDHGQRVRWHDAVWAHVSDRHTLVEPTTPDPPTRVSTATVLHAKVVPPLHGLGASNEDLAKRYPWWSCDSSTYTIPQRFGRTLNARGRQEFIKRPGPRVRDRRDQPPPPEQDLRRIKPAQRVEAIRILDRWKRIERDMTGAWARRGVRYAP